jgi:uncharacterized membrane protein
MKEQKQIKKESKPEDVVKLNMSFEQAVKTALSTPLPKRKKKKK